MSLSLDTNILIYSVDDRDVLKQDIARLVLYRALEVGAILALQVVGEYQNALKRRIINPFTDEGLSPRARAVLNL